MDIHQDTHKHPNKDLHLGMDRHPDRDIHLNREIHRTRTYTWTRTDIRTRTDKQKRTYTYTLTDTWTPTLSTWTVAASCCRRGHCVAESCRRPSTPCPWTSFGQWSKESPRRYDCGLSTPDSGFGTTWLNVTVGPRNETAKDPASAAGDLRLVPSRNDARA